MVLYELQQQLQTKEELFAEERNEFCKAKENMQHEIEEVSVILFFYMPTVCLQ